MHNNKIIYLIYKNSIIFVKYVPKMIIRSKKGLMKVRPLFVVLTSDIFLIWISDDLVVFVAGPPGFEPGTSGSAGRRSILAELRAQSLYWAQW